VLRVHKDPISIIAKILEQNPKSYTQLHDLLTVGTHMVEAGLTAHSKTLTPEEETTHRLTAERRITAMCIDAALAEDDFGTAYSYIVNRLAPSSPTSPATVTVADDYSWKAALQAGKHRRTHHPHHTTTTHRTGGGGGGIATSANPDVRHLEQRIDCLATALRVAPPQTLQEIVNAFRRAEEELEVLVREEEQQEDEWDARGDHLLLRHGQGGMPGGFVTTTSSSKQQSTVRAGGGGGRRQSKSAADEDTAPMSLFDLSRASVLSAQRNLSALSGLQRSASAGLGRLAGGGGGGGGSGRGERSLGDDTGGRSSMDMPPLSATGSVASAGSGAAEEDRRVRKRDQLREAAMGTLVSGVGWLVGAPAPGAQPRE
jgi:hypothetical protein